MIDAFDNVISTKKSVSGLSILGCGISCGRSKVGWEWWLSSVVVALVGGGRVRGGCSVREGGVL